MNRTEIIEKFKDYLLNFGLYTKFNIDNADKNIFISLIYDKNFTLNAYCSKCKKNSVFRYSNATIHNIELKSSRARPLENALAQNHLTALGNLYRQFEDDLERMFSNYYYFNCAIDPSHKTLFYFNVGKDYIEKIGQYPSLADMQFHELKKYSNILGKYYNELSKAMGLYSHGIGVGSFVYLRRIFEHIIEEEHKLIINKENWDESKYRKLDFISKIKMCEEYVEIIPTEFSDKKGLIYGILSKGIHEYDEKECLNLFTSLKYLIELILDKHLEKKKRTEKMNEALNALSSKKN